MSTSGSSCCRRRSDGAINHAQPESLLHLHAATVTCCAPAACPERVQVVLNTLFKRPCEICKSAARASVEHCRVRREDPRAAAQDQARIVVSSAVVVQQRALASSAGCVPERRLPACHTICDRSANLRRAPPRESARCSSYHSSGSAHFSGGGVFHVPGVQFVAVFS